MKYGVGEPKRKGNVCASISLHILLAKPTRLIFSVTKDMNLTTGCCQHIHTWIELQAAKAPESIALISGEEQYTYSYLNQRSNQLAHHLQSVGVAAETLVGICIERSPEMIVAILAVLKAGGAYVPIDACYPKERISLILEDSQLSVLIVDVQQTALELEKLRNSRIVCLEQDKAAIEQYSCQNLPAKPESRLAYVIYTSGSTGKPKGVMVEHSSLMNFVQTAGKAYEVSAQDRILQFASISFDISVEEIFVALAHGATLVFRSDEMLRSSAAFFETCQDWQISVVDLPTAFWHKLCADLSDTAFPDALRLVIIGGERAVPQWLDLWRQYAPDSVRLVNTYGPTEATVITTLCDIAGPNAIDIGDGRTIPIGKPLENVHTFVLNEDLHQVSDGEAGELYIAGQGLARGYLHRRDLTEANYPYIEIESRGLVRLYKTGDRVYRHSDGHLRFLGRFDNQQKIRGFRVELGEIEDVLEQHPKVQEAIVLVREDIPGDKRLFAYVVLNEQTSAARTLARLTSEEVTTLRSHIQGKLPGYMVPSAFVLLETLPLSPNGKVDRRKLPAPNIERPALIEPYVSPRTPLETDIASAWCQLLGVDRIGINDNFFELGGNSLQTMTLVAYLEKTHQISISLKDFLALPSVAGIATLATQQFDQKTVDKPTEHMSIAQMEAESINCWNDAALSPLFEKSSKEKPLRNHLFVTGATGFLGTSLLQALLAQTPASTKIYCLIRAHDAVDAQQKLQIAIAKYLHGAEISCDRLIPVVGDLSAPYLGIEKEQFAEIARSTQAIYHSGASVNMFYPYTALKSVNVSGTQEVIRLAATGPLKVLHHISTLDVFESLARTGADILYESDSPAQGEGISGGYAQSKWVAERIVRLAQAAGLPVCLYRPGMISGHSQTGYANTQDVLCRFIKTLVQMKAAPKLDLNIDMTPVDYVSRAIAQLSFQSEAVGQTFHIVNPQPLSLSQMVETLQSNHYEITTIQSDHWLKRWSSEPHALSALAAFTAEATPEEQRVCLELWLGGHYVFDCSSTIQCLKGQRVFCPPADSKLLSTYLSYFTKANFISRDNTRTDKEQLSLLTT